MSNTKDRAREIAERWEGGGPVESRSKKFRTGKLAADIQAALDEEWNIAIGAVLAHLDKGNLWIHESNVRALKRT